MNGKVYKVKNSNNGKIYIGVTTKTVEDRKQDHEQKAQKGIRSYFQEAIATYGPEAFTWEQIDTANDTNELADKERQYILKYNSLEKGYNSDSGGGFKKMVYQYSKHEKRLVKTHNSLREAADEVNATSTSISNACLGYNLSCKGFCWSYSSPKTYIRNNDRRMKAVEQYDLFGALIATYESVAEASRQTGVSKTCIARCCRGERNSSSGFRWFYK